MEYWAILKEHEFYLGAWDYDNLEECNITEIVELDQSKLESDKWKCCIFSSVGTLFDYYSGRGIEFPMDKEEFLRLCCNEAENYGWKDKKGMYLYRAIDLVRNVHNSISKNKIVSLSVEVWSDYWYYVLDKGYSLATGVYASRDYLKDLRDNGIIDEVHDVKGIWHSPRNQEKYSVKFNIIDNYKDKLWDKNKYLNEHIEEMKELGTWFKYAYFFVFDDLTEDRLYYIAEIKKRLSGLRKNQKNRLREVIEKEWIKSGYYFLRFMLGEIEITRNENWKITSA